MTGWVSGGQQTEVIPPLAAAVVSDVMDATCSCPGSRMCADKSTSPGQTMSPSASIVLSGVNFDCFLSTDRIFPSSIYKSPFLSRLFAGSIIRPFVILIRIFIPCISI